MKICQQSSNLVKIGQTCQTHYIKTCLRFIARVKWYQTVRIDEEV